MPTKLALLAICLLGSSAYACSDKVSEYDREQMYDLVLQVQEALTKLPEHRRCTLPKHAVIPTGVEQAIKEVSLDDIVEWRRDSDAVTIFVRIESKTYSLDIRVRDDFCYQFELYEIVN